MTLNARTKPLLRSGYIPWERSCYSPSCTISKKSDRANQGEQAWMGLMAASYFSHRQVGGWIELRRISVQHGLRLISLSNYVFVLEISQISGIVQNVSMLIMVVMRIVVVVREEKVEKECHWNRKLSVIQVLSICSVWFTWKMLLLSVNHSVPPPPTPLQGHTYFLWQTTKRSPFISPLVCQLHVCHSIKM